MRLTRALRPLLIAFFCGLAALFFLTALLNGLAERRLDRALRRLPDQDFTAHILALEAQGRVSEALDWARYVTNNPALPNQAAASNLAVRLEAVQSSVWRQADRAAKGFLTGSGASVEELGGAIASDMVVYGDCRDLLVQGYYKLTKHETDAVVAALASVGLLTELVDAVDWAPAMLKAFRKANALSQRFGEWLIRTCRSSLSARRIDPALKALFADLKRLHERLGLARTAAVFRQVGDADDVSLLARCAESRPGELYRFAATAGDDALPLLRRYADAPRGFDTLALATRKGAPGLASLRRGGELRAVTLAARYGERICRSLRLQRPQRFLQALIQRSPAARVALWCAVALLSLIALWQALAAIGRSRARSTLNVQR